MKKLAYIKFIPLLSLAIILASCKHPTPDATTGEGTNIDGNGDLGPAVGDSAMGSANGGQDAFGGVPETTRPSSVNGVEYGKWEPIHFDYDSAAIQSSDRGTLEEIANWCKENPGKKIIIEGHCDERGTREYNRALGQRRASAAREYLVKLGVEPSSLSTISYGEEKPMEPSHDESAWTKNRRDEFGLLP